MIGIDKLIFDKDGSANWTNILNAQTGTWRTDGRELRQRILNAVEARLRTESGAAVPESEVARGAQRFMPMIGDTPTQLNQKMDRLNLFIDEASDFIDPTGHNRGPVSESATTTDENDPLGIR